jgi:DNA-binding response OmpR family regulator
MLPPHRPESLSSSLSACAGKAQSAPKTVLLIEDEESIAQMLLLIFSRSGMSVLWARDGAEGLSLFQENQERISVAFVDCRLPDIDGAEICRRLRAAAPGLPVLLTSGREQQAAQQWLKASGPTAFVTKPYLPTELVGRVRTLLQTAA